MLILDENLLELEEKVNHYYAIFEAFQRNQDLSFVRGQASFRWDMLRDRTNMKGVDRQIAFMPGKSDNWAAVVLKWDENGDIWVAYPKDEYYFSRLGILSIKYGREKLYNHLDILYNISDDFVDSKVLQLIDILSKAYDRDEDEIYNLFLHIYYGMIAEEHYQRVYFNGNVQKTKVGKLVKMVGLCGFLYDYKDVRFVCDETRGMNASGIYELASKYGLKREVTWNPYSTVYDDPNDHSITIENNDDPMGLRDFEEVNNEMQ